jgi:hypothetical protein
VRGRSLGESAAAVIGTITFAAAFASASQVGIEQSSRLFILPDVAIDGLVTDRELAFSAQVSGDLLRAPLLTDQIVDQGEVPGCKTLITTGARAAPVGSLLGGGGAGCGPSARVLLRRTSRQTVERWRPMARAIWD